MRRWLLEEFDRSFAWKQNYHRIPAINPILRSCSVAGAVSSQRRYLGFSDTASPPTYSESGHVRAATTGKYDIDAKIGEYCQK